MGKERLEVIKEHFKYCIDHGITLAEQEEKLLNELYQQAERGIELENEIKSHTPHGRNYTNEQYVELLIETNRLKEENEELAVAHENALKEISVLKNKIKRLERQ